MRSGRVRCSIAKNMSSTFESISLKIDKMGAIQSLWESVDRTMKKQRNASGISKQKLMAGKQEQDPWKKS